MALVSPSNVENKDSLGSKSLSDVFFSFLFAEGPCISGRTSSGRSGSSVVGKRRLYFLLIFLGKFASFSKGFFLFFWELHFVEKGFKNLCSSLFFQQFFLSFLHLHILPQGQSGGEGWWVVNSPCLSAHTNINLTLAFFPHFFYIHIGGDLAAFPRVFSFFFGSYTLWKRVLKIHAVVFFFQQFFYLFTLTHITTRAVRWGRLVGGKFPMPVCPYTHQLDTAISLPIFSFDCI